jgi:hypothetical protein
MLWFISIHKYLTAPKLDLLVHLTWTVLSLTCQNSQMMNFCTFWLNQSLLGSVICLQDACRLSLVHLLSFYLALYAILWLSSLYLCCCLSSVISPMKHIFKLLSTVVLGIYLMLKPILRLLSLRKTILMDFPLPSSAQWSHVSPMITPLVQHQGPECIVWCAGQDLNYNFKLCYWLCIGLCYVVLAVDTAITMHWAMIELYITDSMRGSGRVWTIYSEGQNCSSV